MCLGTREEHGLERGLELEQGTWNGCCLPYPLVSLPIIPHSFDVETMAHNRHLEGEGIWLIPPCAVEMSLSALAFLGSVPASHLLADIPDDSSRQVFVSVTWADNDMQAT